MNIREVRGGVRRTASLVASMLLVIMVVGCQSDGTAPADRGKLSGAASAVFPVTIKHQFGTTTIESEPKRVLTAGFNEQDFVLAFGIEPVGVRQFLGYDAPNRPWTPQAVRGKKLPTVGSQEIDFEKIAELKPDLIMAVSSYIDKAGYAKLSAIAPTVAQSGDVATGATSWQDQTKITGRALGRPDKAEQIVRRTEDRFAEAKKEHPEFAGKSASFALGVTTDGAYSVGADDYRTGWLTELGFTVPKKGGEVSMEKLDVFDTDVMVAEGVQKSVQKNRLFAQLAPVKEGRFVDLGAFDQDFAGALGFNSPLSIPYLLDIAVPRLAAAADDDPQTKPEPYRG
ncbi:iron-siderophore ABC transporter substrate-binding protein [Microlunatus soli]|uniref:Iron complex transport system substrate-binding protein n=1 Tax=Microlunatus soli TaxID=630515 RepID=A0A1H1PV15_9ACTN|nr:iron-siderophore ABC transporter substrate-binding protein [Microlunatus soli]SDS14857.1 iron complex transport system substrate-binding protein [Microlunatus soli]